MGWSTQEIADLAGTTLRTVRHYHEIGLLAEPPREANGYKDYGVSHLTQLLRIRRLVDFGAPLSEIRSMGLGDGTEAASAEYRDTLRHLDDEAERAIQRLETIRAGIREELDAEESAARSDRGAPALSDADEDFMAVLSRLLGAETMSSWNEMVQTTPENAALTEFVDLDESSTTEARSDLATRLAEVVRRIYSDHPELADPDFAPGRQRPLAPAALGIALRELYRPAQLDVLGRLNTLINE